MILFDLCQHSYVFRNLYGHNLVGLESGDLLVIGGVIEYEPLESELRTVIWRMSATDGSVTKAGDLQEVTLTIIPVIILFNNLVNLSRISTNDG